MARRREARPAVPATATISTPATSALSAAGVAFSVHPRDAERVTGYVVGGISPVGQRHPLTTVVDGAAAGWPVIYVSAGRRGVDIALAPADLIAATSAAVADISC